MSRRGGTGGGEWVHPKDANSMAFGFRKDVVGTCVSFLPWMKGLGKQSFLKDFHSMDRQYLDDSTDY